MKHVTVIKHEITGSGTVLQLITIKFSNVSC